MKTKGFNLWQRLSFAFTNSSYPFPPGGQNNDNIERNRDNPLFGGDSENLVMRLSTVYACVRLISGTISTLPLCIYQRLPNGDVQERPDMTLSQLLSVQPNAKQTAQTFWQAYIASMLLRGPGYAQVDRDSVGNPISLYFLDPRRTSWFRGQDGVINYRYAPWSGQTVQLVPGQNLFQTLAFTEDGQVPISPIRQGASVFYSALSADMAANSTFARGLLPTTYFKYPKVMKADQREEARKTIETLSGAVHAGRPIVLEAEMDAGNLGINPIDAQLLESRSWSVEEICRWFGVPPHMVGHMDKSTSWGTGLEQNTIGFITYCLRYWLTSTEQSINMNLLNPSQRTRFFARFNIMGLLRADSAARQALYSSAVQNGWMTRAEVRRLENLPFIDGSDVLTAQSNLLPLTDLGQQQAAPIVLQDALKNFLGMVQHGQGT